MVVTNILSRAMLSDSTPEIPEEEINHYVHTVKANLPISDSKFEQFANETNADPTIQKLIKNMLHQDGQTAEMKSSIL